MSVLFRNPSGVATTKARSAASASTTTSHGNGKVGLCGLSGEEELSASMRFNGGDYSRACSERKYIKPEIGLDLPPEKVDTEISYVYTIFRRKTNDKDQTNIYR